MGDGDVVLMCGGGGGKSACHMIPHQSLPHHHHAPAHVQPSLPSTKSQIPWLVTGRRSDYMILLPPLYHTATKVVATLPLAIYVTDYLRIVLRLFY